MTEYELDLLTSSGLFDETWYCETYPDVELLNMNPAEHFLRFGWLLNRKPSKDFDPEKIRDFAGANGSVRRNPVLAYIEQQRLHGTEAATQRAVQPPSAPVLVRRVQNGASTHSGPRENEVTKPSTKITSDQEQSDYKLLLTEFDEQFYLRRYQDIMRSRIDPAMHFLKHGGFEMRNPNAEFDTRYYVSQNPELKAKKVNPFIHYLRVGRAEGRQPNALSAGNPHFNRVAEMLNLLPSELERSVADRKRDIRERLRSGELGQMVAKAEQYDPLVKHVWLAALNPGISPIRSPGWTHQIAAMDRLQESAGWRRAKVAVLIPWVHVSGAARVAGFLATALASLFDPDDIVVIRTETSEFQFPEWFPGGCRHVDLAAETQGMEASQKERLLVEFLRSLKLQHVFNVNSRTFWNALEHFGVALSKSMKLHTYLFCNEKNVYGDWVGYPVRKYHKYSDILDTVVCDSEFLADELRERFLIPPQRADELRVLDTPVNSVIRAVTPATRVHGDRPRVYWAGRFDRQKRVDIAFAVAERMPDVDFHFWGKPTLDKDFDKLTIPDNVTLEGTYKDFEELPLSSCDAWLYTAEWDGVPNILLDVAIAAIPLVGSVVGGTGAVLVDGMSAPVRDFEDVDAYIAALRTVIADPTEAKKRALKLRSLIISKRSTAAYTAGVKSLLERGEEDV